MKGTCFFVYTPTLATRPCQFFFYVSSQTCFWFHKFIALVSQISLTYSLFSGSMTRAWILFGMLNGCCLWCYEKTCSVHIDLAFALSFMMLVLPVMRMKNCNEVS